MKDVVILADVARIALENFSMDENQRLPRPAIDSINMSIDCNMHKGNTSLYIFFKGGEHVVCMCITFQVTVSIIFVYSISLSSALHPEGNIFFWQTTLWVIESVDWRPWISDVLHSDPCSVRRSLDLTPPILSQPSRHQLKVSLLQVCPTNNQEITNAHMKQLITVWTVRNHGLVGFTNANIQTWMLQL